MTFGPIKRQKIGADEERFWNAIDVWLTNPHVVNRRILASQRIFIAEIKKKPSDVCDRIVDLRLSLNLAKNETCEEDGRELLRALNISEADLLENSRPMRSYKEGVYLCATKLLPRSATLFSPTIELTLVDKGSRSVTTFYKVVRPPARSLGPREPFAIRLEENHEVSLSTWRMSDVADTSVGWLQDRFFPRLIKWMESSEANVEVEAGRAKINSLTLVSPEKYASLYARLKDKYGKQLVEIWPEQTDPAKFVFEDIAIATYLLLLWEKERTERDVEGPQSFVDLGCGNGLLVHILSSEGHRGVGIDVRKRKLWDLFPRDTRLEVSTIVPSSSTIFPDVDWIIGNHSDELSPWVPVIAARSSPNCRFFLLPCCAYEFDGSKYRRRCAAQSQYSEYVDYLREISDRCGFATYLDKLRIPSTKRTCLVGRRKHGDGWEMREREIRDMVKAKSKSGVLQVDGGDASAADESWSCEFKPRDAVEKVRNCTQLDKALVARILKVVSGQLLDKGRIIELGPENGRVFLWNAGRRLELKTLAESIEPPILKELRHECGGLQTLLKNYSHVFRVFEGKVEFRIPGERSERKQRAASRTSKKKVASPMKIKPCWFYQNHPDGCPLTEQVCRFEH